MWSGDDLDALKKNGDQIAASAGKVRGGEDVKVEQIASCPQLQIKPDRAAIAPYGINVEDVNTLSNRLSPERKSDKSSRS